jgi:hypothetical protein
MNKCNFPGFPCPKRCEKGDSMYLINNEVKFTSPLRPIEEGSKEIDRDRSTVAVDVDDTIIDTVSRK